MMQVLHLSSANKIAPILDIAYFFSTPAWNISTNPSWEVARGVLWWFLPRMDQILHSFLKGVHGPLSHASASRQRLIHIQLLEI
jgi:hypothetical protein